MTISFTSGANNVAIKNPELGNQENAKFFRAVNKSRHGKLSMYRNGTWPTSVEHSLEFAAIASADIEAVKDYFAATVGLEQTYIDTAGNIWTGIIVGTVESAQAGIDSHTLSVQFEGVLRVPLDRITYSETVIGVVQ